MPSQEFHFIFLLFLRGAGQAGKFPILYKFKSGLRGKRKPVLINSLALLSHFFLLDEGRN